MAVITTLVPLGHLLPGIHTVGTILSLLDQMKWDVGLALIDVDDLDGTVRFSYTFESWDVRLRVADFAAMRIFGWWLYNDSRHRRGSTHHRHDGGLTVMNAELEGSKCKECRARGLGKGGRSVWICKGMERHKVEEVFVLTRLLL